MTNGSGMTLRKGKIILNAIFVVKISEYYEIFKTIFLRELPVIVVGKPVVKITGKVHHYYKD
jgi:hypothetical protein